MPLIRGTRYSTLSRGSAVAAVPSPILGLFTYYWALDEASGVASSSAEAADLTATNSPVAGTGKVGNGREFVAASSQQLQRDMILGVSYNTDWTLCFWAKPDSVTGFQGFVFKGVPIANFRIFASSSAFSFDINGGPSYNSAAGFFSIGTWCQVTLTYLGTGDKKFRLYKDGSLFHTTAANAGLQLDSDATRPFVIGSLSGSSYLSGIMDEVGFAASTCFSDTQVTAYYDATNAGRGYPNF